MPDFLTGEENPSYLHGMSRTPTFITWDQVKQRCLNPNNKSYKRYGGRGITIDPEWAISFLSFLSDMGERPEGTTLDRIDNNKGYYKNNCKWSTPKQQANNRRSNVFVEFDNKRLTISQWADELGVCRKSLRHRLNSPKWTIESALTTPFKRYKRRD